MSSKVLKKLQIKFIIISAPSGTGKTTIVQKILSEFSSLVFSVSATTRTPRLNEKDGKDYYFIDKDTFLHYVAQEKFIEFEEVYNGTYYGTLLSEIERIEKLNKNIIFEIDVKGAVRLKKKLKDKAISVFIEPPSIEELEKRLKKRGKESKESIKMRIERAKKELTMKNHFDHAFINQDLDDCYLQIKEVIQYFLRS